METCTFDDEDVISIDSVFEKNKIPPVAEELDRGAKLYDERLYMKRKKKGQLKPLYDEARKKKHQFSKIAVYKLCCYTPKLKDSQNIDYPACKHTGNIIIDRDILSQDEHMAFLAQPKVKGEPIPRKYKAHCYYIKRYLPNCTTRIERLSAPKKRKVLMTIKNFAKFLSARHVDNLTRLVVNEDTKFTDIERAISLRREENKKKLIRRARILRECAKVKRQIIKMRKAQVRQITYAIYGIMKPFLMQVHKVEMSSGMKILTEVLECKIKTFTGMLTSSELVDKFLKNLAKNLAIWMEKFITNFGFESLMQAASADGSRICPCEQREFRKQLPIDDYIEVSEEVEMEEYEGQGEFFGPEEWEILGEESIGEEGLVPEPQKPIPPAGEEEAEAEGNGEQAAEEE